VAIAVRARPRFETIVLAILICFLIVLDQTRCQPWVYQYWLMLLVLVPQCGSQQLPDTTIARLATLRLILASVYFWRGAQKINRLFFLDTYPWLIEPIARHLPASVNPILHVAGYGFPATEMFIGIALLFHRLSAIAGLLAIGMHIFILFLLGPLGHNANSIVWPWNVAMIGFICLLFGGTTGLHLRLAWSARPVLLRRAVVVAVGILPALNFVGLWDHDLSWALYSGGLPEATVYMDQAVLPCLPAGVRAHIKLEGDAAVLEVWDWAIEALNVPPYPERWVYRRIADELCTCDPKGGLIVFDIWDWARWRPTEVEEYECADKW